MFAKIADLTVHAVLTVLFALARLVLACLVCVATCGLVALVAGLVASVIGVEVAPVFGVTLVIMIGLVVGAKAGYWLEDVANGE